MLSVVIFLTLTTNILAQDCYLVLEEKSPFVLNQDLLFPPVSEIPAYIKFAQNETFYIQCAKGTFHKQIAEDGEEVVCQTYNNILNVRTGKIFDFRNTQCKRKLTVTQRLNESCVNDGTKLQIGFEILQTVIPVIEVCFDEANLTPIYVKFDQTNYYIESSRSARDGIFSLCNDPTVCDFVDGANLYPDIDMDGIYSNQKKILSNLGISLDSDLYLVRTELATDLLFYDPLEKYASLDYSIITPMWNKYSNSFSLGMVVEARTNQMSTFYSGTLGVATVPNSDEEDVELYLYYGKMPVARWVWYLVYNETTASVYLNYNYPNVMNQIPIFEEWYATICSQNGGYFGGYSGYCFVESLISAELKKIVSDFWPPKN